MTPAELRYIEAGREAEGPALAGGYWRQMRPILTQPVFWIMMLGGIFNNAAAHGIMNWLPTYFVKERGIEFSSLWWASSLPNLFGVAGIALWAWVGDRWQKRALLSGVCYLVTGGVALLAALAGSIYTCVGFFSIAVFFQMAYTSQEFALVQRIIPKERIGTGSGFYNGGTMLIGGVAGNLTIGQVVSATGSYQAGIIALLSFAALAGIMMIVLARRLKY
jgi:sugar phosphate permease